MRHIDEKSPRAVAESMLARELAKTCSQLVSKMGEGWDIAAVITGPNGHAAAGTNCGEAGMLELFATYLQNRGLVVSKKPEPESAANDSPGHATVQVDERHFGDGTPNDHTRAIREKLILTLPRLFKTLQPLIDEQFGGGTVAMVFNVDGGRCRVLAGVDGEHGAIRDVVGIMELLGWTCTPPDGSEAASRPTMQ